MGGTLWYLRMVLDRTWRLRYICLLIAAFVFGVWNTIAAFAVLGIIPSDGSRSNTNIRTTVMFTVLATLTHNAFMLAYVIGVMRYSREVDGMELNLDGPGVMGVGPPADPVPYSAHAHMAAAGRGRGSDSEYAAVRQEAAPVKEAAGERGAPSVMSRFSLPIPSVLRPEPSAPPAPANYAAPAAAGYDRDEYDPQEGLEMRAPRRTLVESEDSDDDADDDSDLSNPSDTEVETSLELSMATETAGDTSAVEVSGAGEGEAYEPTYVAELAETDGNEAPSGGGGGGEADLYGGRQQFLATPAHEIDAPPASAAVQRAVPGHDDGSPSSSVTSASLATPGRTPARVPHTVNLTPQALAAVQTVRDAPGSGMSTIEAPVAGDGDAAADTLSPEQFEELWASLQHVGSFACYISEVPSLEALMAHLTERQFVPMASGVLGDEMKLFFYADEPLSEGCFLSVLVFSVAEKKLVAEFKASDEEHLTVVQRFDLHLLFSVVGTADE